MVKNIIVPVDETPGSERAVPVAATLAAALGARLELVTVESPHVDAFAATAYHGQLLAAVPPAIETGSIVTFTDGAVADALQVVARARPGSIVCMATRASAPIAEIVLGSTADHLLRSSNRPVLLVGPACEPAWPHTAVGAVRLVAALDGSCLDDDVTTTALAWAEMLGLAICFVTVTTDLGAPGIPSPGVAILARAAAAAAEAERPASTTLVEGTDSAALVLAEVQGAPALLVVGSHRRGPFSRMALGANALWLVHRARCPVLVAGTERRSDVR